MFRFWSWAVSFRCPGDAGFLRRGGWVAGGLLVLQAKGLRRMYLSGTVGLSVRRSIRVQDLGVDAVVLRAAIVGSVATCL